MNRSIDYWEVARETVSISTVLGPSQPPQRKWVSSAPKYHYPLGPISDRQAYAEMSISSESTAKASDRTFHCESTAI